MSEFVLNLQGMGSEEASEGPMASDYTTVLCGHSWASITC